VLETEYSELRYTGEWTTVTAWDGAISVSIPSEWQYFEHIPGVDDDPFLGFMIFGEGAGGTIEIDIFASPVAPPTLLEGFARNQIDYEQIQFDSGRTGYMVEWDDEAITWQHHEPMVGLTDISLRHAGNRALFTDNEHLIMRIVKSFRINT